jgi:hypothetical protein
MTTPWAPPDLPQSIDPREIPQSPLARCRWCCGLWRLLIFWAHILVVEALVIFVFAMPAANWLVTGRWWWPYSRPLGQAVPVLVLALVPSCVLLRPWVHRWLEPSNRWLEAKLLPDECRR